MQMRSMPISEREREREGERVRERERNEDVGGYFVQSTLQVQNDKKDTIDKNCIT
jgi:hypothetical protein